MLNIEILMENVMFRAVTLSVAVLIMSQLITSCASDAYISVDSEVLKEFNSTKTVNIYNIGVDDTVKINVWRNPELSVTVPVRPDGKISLPLVGDVHAEGKTPEQVSMDIQNKLKKYVKDPNVTLMVTGLKSNEYLTRLRITGAVNNPISLNFRQGMTVLDAVLAAGNINDFASPNNTKLYRKIKNRTRIFNIYLGDILYKGELLTNIELRPGDILTVPERLF